MNHVRSLQPAIKISLNEQDIVTCNAIFFQIRRLLNGVTPVEFFEPELATSALRDNLNDKIQYEIRERREDTDVNYHLKLQFAAYDIRYFYRNLYKYISVSCYVQRSHPELNRYISLVDVGSGSGTFAVAWLAVAAKLKNHLPMAVILNDEATLQRSISLRHFDHLRENMIFGESEIAHVTVFRDFRERPPIRDALYLLGYVLPGKDINPDILASLGDHNVFVDYNRNLDKLEDALGNYRAQRSVIHSKIPSNFLVDVKSPTLDAKFVYFAMKNSSISIW